MCYGIYGLYDSTNLYIAEINWKEKYIDVVGRVFINRLLKTLESFDDNPENVRIVFWFDN